MTVTPLGVGGLFKGLPTYLTERHYNYDILDLTFTGASAQFSPEKGGQSPRTGFLRLLQEEGAPSPA